MSRDNRAVLITIVVAMVIGALVAIAGSVRGATFGGVPIFALAVGGAFLVQFIFYVPAVIFKTEKFFDLTGAATFTLITLGVLALTPAPDLRSWVLAALIIIWALRLGPFLFLRVRAAGSDTRFDEIKGRPLVFLRVWVLQGLWVSLTASAAWVAMSSQSADRKPFGVLSAIGVAIWLLGFVIEVVADAQKSAFKRNPANEGKFIKTGLWSRSRHPNYFGEIVLWVGVFLVAAPQLSGWQWVVLLSPIFVTLLLTRISGIPMLEAKAQKNWGDQTDYKTYIEHTPILLPRLTA